jgi:polysaccharide pyruvyl transferase WcaK-like protein
MARRAGDGRRLCIGVLAHAGTRNLGDEALVAAVVQGIRRRYPDAEIRAFTGDPDDTRLRHGVVAFPIRNRRPPAPGTARAASRGSGVVAGLVARVKGVVKAVRPLHRAAVGARRGLVMVRSAVAEPAFLLRCYRRLRGVRLLLIAGSQQLNDAYGGPWGFPYTLWKWSALAKIAGAKVAFLSVGAGPIRAPLSRLFVRRALALASYRSHRDTLSAELVRSLGVRGAGHVVPDLAYGLRATPGAASVRPASLPGVVGINPVPFFDARYWPEADSGRYARYVAALAGFADWLVERDHRVLFFPTQLRADPPVIVDIRDAMRAGAGGQAWRVLAPPRIGSLGDLMAAIARTDVVVASRYHGILLGLLLEKPVLGLAYHGKSVELMARIGQGEYVLDAGRCSTAALIERFTALTAQAEAARAAIRERIGGLRDAVRAQYDRVFELVGGPAPRRSPEGRPRPAGVDA